MKNIKCKILGHNYRNQLEDKHHKGSAYTLLCCRRCGNVEHFSDDAFKPNQRLRNPLMWLILPLYFPVALLFFILIGVAGIFARVFEKLSEYCFSCSNCLTAIHGILADFISKTVKKADPHVKHHYYAKDEWVMRKRWFFDKKCYQCESNDNAERFVKNLMLIQQKKDSEQ